MNPIYDINKSYHENAKRGPIYSGKIPQRTLNPQYDFLGFKVASKIGVPAGPLLNSQWILFAANMGFDILTYKTIRSHPFDGHPLPNIIHVQAPNQLIPKNLPPFLTSALPPKDINSLAITNSFGNPSKPSSYLKEDIPKANRGLKKGQVMIVSIFGSGHDEKSIINDFVKTAALAKSYGANIIEANFSCPNICNGEGLLYHDPNLVYRLSLAIVKEINPIPLIIKVGLFHSLQNHTEIFTKASQAGVKAVCGINTITMKVLDQKGAPALGEKRVKSGICGNPIRYAALDFVKTSRKIIDKEKLPLTLIGCGGIMTPIHFDHFFHAGADFALSATAMMWDPLLASKYHSRISLSKKEKAYN